MMGKTLLIASMFTAIFHAASGASCMTCDGWPCLERQHQRECAADMFCVTSHLFLPDTRLQVTKRCVPEDVCRDMTRRFLESTRCQRLYSESVVVNLFHRIQYKDLQCDFCCLGAMCNIDYYPARLYNIDNFVLDSQSLGDMTKDNNKSSTIFVDKSADIPEPLAIPDSIEAPHVPVAPEVPIPKPITSPTDATDGLALEGDNTTQASDSLGEVKMKSETPASVATQMLTASEGPNNGVSTTRCWFCQGQGCPSAQTEVNCPSGLCLTSLTQFADYRPREMMKKCVGKQECLEKWWMESSDTKCVNMLMEKQLAGTGNDVTCHYCCHGNVCNQETYPEPETLVEPSMLLD